MIQKFFRKVFRIVVMRLVLAEEKLALVYLKSLKQLPHTVHISKMFNMKTMLQILFNTIRFSCQNALFL